MLKRFLALGIWLLLMGIKAEAAPALRIPFTVRQADGTLLTIEQFGDEYHHWTATTDGIILVSSARGYCVGHIDSLGRLSDTGVLAHEPLLRSDAERRIVAQQQQRLPLFHERGLQASHRVPSLGEGAYLPHSGKPRILTILAAYKDAPFTVNDPVAAFGQYLNGEEQQDLGNHNTLNTASVRHYFEACSGGQFSPQFDIVGPITLPKSMKYYGGSKSGGKDDRFNDFCKDAIAQLDTLVSDWRPYDNDGDGRVELVCIIFAGYGQNQGGADSTLWAKASRLNMNLGDTLSISRFNCCSELFYPQYPDYINGTGVFIHEFSHCMGLPDLYATKSQGYVNNQGMEQYSVMDYGLYSYNGFAPTAYNAWEQEVMGWTDIEDIGSLLTDGGCQVNAVVPLLEGGKAYKLVNPDNERDFIVMENIQKRGINYKVQGHGLLVYHVDYPYTEVNMSDAPNNNPGHPSVAVVPAGSVLISSYLRGDGKPYTRDDWNASMAASLFPGTGNVTSLTNGMQLPNYCFWAAETPKPTAFMLQRIEEDAESGTVSFLVATDDPSGIGDVLTDCPNAQQPASVYDLQGRKWSSQPDKGLYIINGRKVVTK